MPVLFKNIVNHSQLKYGERFTRSTIIEGETKLLPAIAFDDGTWGFEVYWKETKKPVKTVYDCKIDPYRL